MMLWDVRPRSSRTDTLNQRVRDAISTSESCQESAFRTLLTNSVNNIFGQLRVRHVAPVNALISCASFSTSVTHIVRMRSKEQMIRIAAARIVSVGTVVQDVHSVRNGSALERPNQAVQQPASLLIPDAHVPLTMQITDADPTSVGFLDVRPNRFWRSMKTHRTSNVRCHTRSVRCAAGYFHRQYIARVT